MVIGSKQKLWQWKVYLPIKAGALKSHMLLLEAVIHDMGDRCCTSTTLDIKYIERRVKHEGLSFLTITLTDFGKGFELCLDQGHVTPSDFTGYVKNGYLPRFLGGFTERVFDAKSGVLLDEPCIESIRAIRQITLMNGKINLPCSDARVDVAFKKFIECEKQLDVTVASTPLELREEFRRTSVALFDKIFSVIDKKIYDSDIIPKHGPGATADKLNGNAKYNQTQWTHRLEKYFPHGEYIFPSWSHFCDAEDIELLEPEAEIPVRVIAVPKTLKTPRIIAIEPTCMQYVQQGILEVIVEQIEGHNYLSKLIGFRDQVPNQELAKEGSITGLLATLDLSEASDRVSNQLVHDLVYPFTHFTEGLDATRSNRADVPGYGVIPLTKYASMGSALCFPMEAMVFLTIVTMAVARELKTPPTDNLIAGMIGKVRVYGDDIIVPVEYVHCVVNLLEAFGLKVNEHKSFWTGKFRESCGKEYYAGFDVSLVKVRHLLPTQRKHVREIIGAVSLRNQLYFVGCWKAASSLDTIIERLIPFPLVLPSSPVLGKHDFSGSFDTDKMCPRLQIPLVKGYVVESVIPKSNLEDSGALLKCFLNRGTLPIPDGKHLERAGRPKAVNIKLRKAPSY